MKSPEQDGKHRRLHERIGWLIALKLLRLTADSPDLLAVIKQEGRV